MSVTKVLAQQGLPVNNPVNYILNSTSEAGTLGWSTYADAASASPVDGTGGSANITFTQSMLNPLRGISSFLLTKDAVNRQGEGFSYDFTIDPADITKVLQINFDYKVASGTYTDGDVTVWIIDGANQIQPAPTKIQNAINAERFSGEFQASTSTSYRLVFHMSTSSAAAYSIKFDNFNVGPQAKLYGSPITDWISYTPTLSTASGTMTNTVVFAKWRRVGDSIEVEAALNVLGASGTWSTPRITLPSGLSVDNTKTLGYGIVGNAVVNNTSDNTYFNGKVTFASNLITVNYSTNASGGATVFNQTSPVTIDSGDTIVFNAKVPILGWSSSTIMSSDAATSVVVFSGSSGGAALTAGVTNFPLTAIKDSVDAWTGSTYVVKVAGDYQISGGLGATSNTNIQAYIDGVQILGIGSALSSSNAAISGLLVGLRVGQVVSIRASSSVTVSGAVHFSRISGPAQIAASESVSALYTGAPPTGTLNGSDNITFGTKVKDSHGAYNPTTGEYKAPMSGTYDISAQLIIQGTATIGVGYATIAIKIDGVEKSRNIDGAITVGMFPQINVKSVPLLAGQKVTIHASTQSVTSPIINPAAEFNFFSITRTGQY